MAGSVQRIRGEMINKVDKTGHRGDIFALLV